MKLELLRVSADPDGADSRRMWEWRNDPVTAAMSRTPGTTAWDAHRAWFARAAADPGKTMLMALVNGEPACVVRFDSIADGAEVNINMSPAMRGRRLGRPILTAACAWAFATLALDRIYAEIKPDNAASIRIFEAAGFVFAGQRDGLRTYSLIRPR